MEGHSLLLDESALTGESIGVDKSADVVLPAAVPLAERLNMVFAGTTVLRGRGTRGGDRNRYTHGAGPHRRAS